MGVADVPGAIRLVRAGNVRALDPEPAVFDAMLRGWQDQPDTAPHPGQTASRVTVRATRATPSPSTVTSSTTTDDRWEKAVKNTL